MPRLPILIVLIAPLAAACTAPFGGVGNPAAPGAPPIVVERDRLAEACRQQATRMVEYRDRGQLMRTDETESGRGTDTIAPYGRVAWDRYTQQVTRDRLAADCVRNAAPPVPITSPAAAAAR